MLSWSTAATLSGSLTLAIYDNTALAGSPYRTKQYPGLSFELPEVQPMSAELTGTLTAGPGDVLTVSCDFGNATFATLRIDDHLVCQHGANSGDGCRTDSHLCNGTDSPLPLLSRTSLPIRLAVIVNETQTTPLAIRVQLKAQSGASVSLSPELPLLEVKRRALQSSLLQGWGAFYAMSYLDHVLLPHAARLKLAICEISADGGCLEQGRIDWPDASGLAADIRLGP